MVAMLCGWLRREQQDAIAFLREENRVLKARLEGKRLRLHDSERRRLAELGHRLGRRLLADVATIVTPDTILRWHRELVARSGRTAAGAAGHEDYRLGSERWWSGMPPGTRGGGHAAVER